MPDYSKFDKNQLIKIINRQDKELKTKKYGLVWDSEREPEQVVLDCKNNLPISANPGRGSLSDMMSNRQAGFSNPANAVRAAYRLGAGRNG